MKVNLVTFIKPVSFLEERSFNKMWSCLIILMVCLCAETSAHSFETEDVIPVRLTGRTGGRVAKRSEEQPSFRLTAFGKNFTLNLTPDSTFISPALKVYRIKVKPQDTLESTSNLTDLYKSLNQTEETGTESLKGCFYTGAVDSSEDSIVSVSLCHGILGSFITDGNEYLIEPKFVGLEKYGQLTEQLHVIKRRRFTKSPHVYKQLSDTRDDPMIQMPSRRRRFVSTPRFIETLVVGDSSLTHFYGDEIKHYILTLMSVAAQVFKHPSIKNSISIVIVKMLIVEDEEVGPAISSNGGVALRNFCAWQQLFNPPSHRHPEHYDTAILFTRENICGHQSCDTLGVADVGTMCDTKRSCSVIEDNGLQAAYTTAHELGHVLSMPHDDTKNCEQLFGRFDGHHIMAPVFTQLSVNLPWSPCSALYVTEFFDNGHGDCLLDAPEMIVALPTELPGITYSLDRQCQQIFGEEFSHCPNTSSSEVCGQLWCQQEGQSVCTTRNGSLPWADGTSCGPNRTCLNSVCMSSEDAMRPKPAVDGGWGEWGPWQPCSRSCGGGVMFSYRECNWPSPQNGGKYCIGQRVNYQSCNKQPCENNRGKSFREEQCEKYNNPNHFDVHGNVKQWIPKYAGVSLRDRCKLFCRARGSSEFRVFAPKVIDGTPCGPDTTSFCVQGQCIKAGCDLEIDSSKKLDKCGVCGGNGQSCRMISGSFNKVVHGYRDIVTIPSGATNINIKQQSHGSIPHDGHYLAVRKENGDYILNGNFSVSTVEQYIPVQGAVLKYSGSSTTLERLQSFRQLQEPITIQLLSTTGESIPPKVKYTFYIPKSMSFSKPKDKKNAGKLIHPFGVPKWVSGEWFECSKTCGSGWSRRNVECKDNAGFYSNSCNKDDRPSDIRPCADLPCPMWQIGPWSSCSKTCGHGERERRILCIDYTGKTVEPGNCDNSKMPESVSEKCFYQEC